MIFEWVGKDETGVQKCKKIQKEWEAWVWIGYEINFSLMVVSQKFYRWSEIPFLTRSPILFVFCGKKPKFPFSGQLRATPL